MNLLRTIVSVIGCGAVVFLLVCGETRAQSSTPLADAGAHDAAIAEAVEQALDLFEADAFIETVFSESEVMRYTTATQVYFWLLEQANRPLSADEQAVLRKHLMPLALIMEEAERTATGLDKALETGDLSVLSPDFGPHLVQWWRRQDPLPATAENERLEEHLMRVAFATHKYHSDDEERGFDDRGEIYIRLGKPSRSKSIALRTGALLVQPYTSNIPDNEFWVYKHLGYDAYYVFVRRSKNKPFELGYPTDLIPPDLRNGRRKTDLLLQVMEEIFAQLTLEHGAYGKHYEELSNYLALPPNNARPPHVYAQRAIERAFEDDLQNEWMRQKTVPASYSTTFGPAETLEVPARWARFLDADGTTRTEFYWSLETEALEPSRRLVRQLKRRGHEPSEKYLITAAVAQRTADYQHRDIQTKHFLVRTDAERALPAHTFVARGDTGAYHLAMQWDQQWTRTDNDQALAPGATLKIGTLTVDTLQALHQAGLQLEMSDLKPMRLKPEQPLESATPYPFMRLTPETPLALYFELYHLTFGDDDQTHYTIEYTVTQKAKRGLLPFRQPREGGRVGARSSYTGNSRIAREYVVLDLSTWRDKGEIDISIRATDDTTGARITRTITFDFER